MLDKHRLAYGEVRIFGTPRRLVVSVSDLAPSQLDQEEIIKGPPAERAFDSQGQPTPAAQGFARSKGVHVSDLQIREIDGGQYAVALVHSIGRSAIEVLTDHLPDLIASLKFRKSMRWNSTNVAFSRPIRWLLAMFNDQLVPFEFASIPAGKLTHGLRFLLPEKIEINTPEDYFAVIAGQGILLDPKERMERIQEQVENLASEIKGKPGRGALWHPRFF
jgi:glycyl-tRNA synthetase